MKAHQKFWMIAANSSILLGYFVIVGMRELHKINANASYFIFAVLVLSVMFALSNLRGD